MVPKRWRPPSQSSAGPCPKATRALGGAKAAGASVVAMWWRPLQQGDADRNGPMAAGASVVPKRRKPPPQSGRGPCPKQWDRSDPKAVEAPTRTRQGPRWSQSSLGPHPKAAGAPVVPQQRRPQSQCGGGPGGPKAADAPAMDRGD